MGRKHCGKRRNCSLQAISPIPTVFSKNLYCRRVKTRACLEKVKNWVKMSEDVSLSADLYVRMCYMKNYRQELSRLVHINPFPKKPWFLRVCRTNLLKTLGEKE